MDRSSDEPDHERLAQRRGKSRRPRNRPMNQLLKLAIDRKGALVPRVFPTLLESEGFPNQSRSDSSCMLDSEASMHGSTLFSRST